MFRPARPWFVLWGPDTWQRINLRLGSKWVRAPWGPPWPWQEGKRYVGSPFTFRWDMTRISPSTKVGIPNFVSGPREYIMEGEYVILAMCSWFRISWFRIICWHCWRASGNKWITYVDLLRPLKNHGLIVFILTYTPWLLCHGVAF